MLGFNIYFRFKIVKAQVSRLKMLHPREQRLTKLSGYHRKQNSKARKTKKDNTDSCHPQTKPNGNKTAQTQGETEPVHGSVLLFFVCCIFVGFGFGATWVCMVSVLGSVWPSYPVPPNPKPKTKKQRQIIIYIYIYNSYIIVVINKRFVAPPPKTKTKKQQDTDRR